MFNKESDILLKVCQKSKIIPVVLIDDENDAVPLANALLEGGIDIIEVTLRTPVAINAIKLIAKNVPNICVGAGTLIHPRQIYQVKKAGAFFGVSPGTTSNLLNSAYDAVFPILPGVSTASEVTLWQEYDMNFFKFFPAEPSGGVGFLSALSSPFPNVNFCPTGGISLNNMNDYLKLGNVPCIGGSWIAPRELIKSKSWDKITQLASEAIKVSS